MASMAAPSAGAEISNRLSGCSVAAAAATEQPLRRFEISAPAEGAAIEAMHCAFTVSSAVQERASQERQRMHPQRNFHGIPQLAAGLLPWDDDIGGIWLD
jgi:hypothetical protein